MTNETKSAPTDYCGIAHSPTPQEIWEGLSDKGSAVIKGIASACVDFCDGDLDGSVWTSDVADYSAIPLASVGGVYASLIAKDLIWSTLDEESESRTGFTPLGRAVAEYGRGQQ